MKIQILICTGLMLNDHSNPYIESTIVLSDYYDNYYDNYYIMYPVLTFCYNYSDISL